MKRRNPAGGPYDTFRVVAGERLRYHAGQWHIERIKTGERRKTIPTNLIEDSFIHALGLLADTLESLLAVQDVILCAIYPDVIMGSDALEESESRIIYPMVQDVESGLAGEYSIRITIEVVLRRKLPYECPEDHSRLTCDMRCDCGMTFSTFWLISARKNFVPPIPEVHFLPGLPVVETLDVVGGMRTPVDQPPVLPVLSPLAIERIEE